MAKAQRSMTARRRVRMAAALALIGALIGGTAVSASAATGSGAAVPGAGAADAAASRTVPWASVGAGWSAVIWHPTFVTDADWTTPGTLQLVSPLGVRYSIMSVASGVDLWDLSPDGRRAVVTEDGPHDTTRVRVIDLARRTTAGTFTLPGFVQQVRFSRPGAQALLTIHGDPAVVERRSLTGRLQLRLPSLTNDDVPAVLPSPDGRYLLRGMPNGSVGVLGNATGVTIRTLPAPRGRSCAAVRWWDRSTVELTCSVSDMSKPAQLYLVSVPGGSWRQLTRVPVGGGFGGFEAWQTRVGVLVESPSTCGPGVVSWLTSTGGLRTMTWPGLKRTSADEVALSTVVDSHAYLTLSGCEGPKSIAWIRYDLAAHSARTLAGPGAGGGTVIGQAVIDPLA